MKILATCGPGLEPDSKAHIFILDWKSKTIIDSIEIEHEIYEKSHKGFSGGVLVDGNLIVTSESEIFEFELNPLKLVKRESHPLFNDVHHVGYGNNEYYVSNSGVDTVEVFDRDFKFKKTISLVDKYGYHYNHIKQLFKDDVKRWIERKRGGYWFYSHLKKSHYFKNLRKLFNPIAFHKNDVRFTDFRPHVLHPNHSIFVNGELWVTLWRPGVIISTKDNRIIADGLGRPHDGVLIGNELFVTDCVDNRLIIFEMDESNKKVVQKVMDYEVTPDRMQGFLRGVTADGDSVFCGLSARRNVTDWSFSRILEISKSTKDITDEWRVPVEYGKLVYTMLDVSNFY